MNEDYRFETELNLEIEQNTHTLLFYSHNS